MNLPGGFEWIIIIVLILIIFGGGRAVSSMKKAGSELYKIKKNIDDIKDITRR